MILIFHCQGQILQILEIEEKKLQIPLNIYRIYTHNTMACNAVCMTRPTMARKAFTGATGVLSIENEIDVYPCIHIRVIDFIR